MICLKKLFFLILLFFPVLVNASKISNLKVLNGTLSREFEPTNNLYSVDLNKGETHLKFDYTLEEAEDVVNMVQEDNKVLLKITSKDNSEETYVFYVNQEYSTPVFKENKVKEGQTKEIPNLKYYVISIVFVIILILFKVIVLGFKH